MRGTPLHGFVSRHSRGIDQENTADRLAMVSLGADCSTAKASRSFNTSLARISAAGRSPHALRTFSRRLKYASPVFGAKVWNSGTSSRHQSVLPLFAVAPPALPHRGDADTPSRIPRLEEYLVSAARRMTHWYRAADCNRSTPCPEPARGARTEVASLSACVDATPAWAPVWSVEFD